MQDEYFNILRKYTDYILICLDVDIEQSLLKAGPRQV